MEVLTPPLPRLPATPPTVNMEEEDKDNLFSLFPVGSTEYFPPSKLTTEGGRHLVKLLLMILLSHFFLATLWRCDSRPGSHFLFLDRVFTFALRRVTDGFTPTPTHCLLPRLVFFSYPTSLVGGRG